MTNLEELDLAECRNLRTLPQSFGRLVNLKSLNLMHCKLECPPESFGRLENLTSLNLMFCNELKTLPSSFGGLKSLTTLDLANSHKLTELPAGVAQLSSLRTLYRGCCYSLQSLPAEGFGTSLQHLSLYQNERFGSLPESFGQLQSLAYINLSGGASNHSFKPMALKSLPESERARLEPSRRRP